MRLERCYIDPRRNRPAWVAQWRTAEGNSINDRLRMGVDGTSEVDAWIFALDHYPVPITRAEVRDALRRHR